MSLSQILSSALSGLNAAQAGIRTASNNIANVNTTGYAREKLSQQTGVAGGRTNGVLVGEPTRVADRYLEDVVLGRASDAGAAATTSDYLQRLQALLGSPGSKTALPGRLQAIIAATTALGGTTGGTTAGTQAAATMMGAIADTVATMQSIGSDVEAMRSEVDQDTGQTVRRINTLLQTLHGLNDDISRAEALGQSSAGAADRRTTAIEELSGLIGIDTQRLPNGRITIATKGGVTLLDKLPRQLSYDSNGSATMTSGYPAIAVHFADEKGVSGAATGETLDGPQLGGKLGGLIDLRDRQLPDFAERLGSVFAGLAKTLNAASNAGTAVPAPNRLEGRPTLLSGSDRLGFSGGITVAVTARDGTLVGQSTINLSGLSTVDDAIAAINAGLGGAATASFTNGSLSITAAGSTNGVVVAQDSSNPSARGGVGFSQYFGLNDVVRSKTAPLVSSGFAATDAHGLNFSAGATVEMAVRDSNGRVAATYSLTGSAGAKVGDLVTELNASPLARYGAFTLDDSGRIRFSASSTNGGAEVSIRRDTTTRGTTGLGFSAMAGFGGNEAGLAGASISSLMTADATRVPLARLQAASVGQKALGVGDRSGASDFINALSTATDLGRDGTTSVQQLATKVLGETAGTASRAKERAEETGDRRSDATARRDSFSGVNLDEELGQLVVLQNSYSASARLISVANQMFDSLLSTIK